MSPLSAREAPPPPKSLDDDGHESLDDDSHGSLDGDSHESLDEDDDEPLEVYDHGALEVYDHDALEVYDGRVGYTLSWKYGVKPAREPEPFDRASQAQHFRKIMRHTSVKFRNTIHVHHKILLGAPIPETTHRSKVVSNGSLSTFLHEHRAVVIGGAIVRDISLLVGDRPSNNGEGQANIHFADVPVVPLQVPESGSVRAQLLSSSDPSSLLDAKPLFVFPEEYIAPPGFEDVATLPLEAVEDLVAESPHQVERTVLDTYTVSGDIVDFWGIKGLTAKLYKHKGEAIV